jgi:hypothetical protein|tara:strand:- start:502 stop:903 length:402 start_codon:yes stop_codon:yes gene_type:complete
MPAKSQKQKRFMAAVANNPKFANQVGVPKSVGEEFMKKSKGKMMGGGKVIKYAEGDIIGASPSGSGATRGPRDRAAEIRAGVPSGSLPEDGREVGKIPKKKKPVKKKMGGGKIKGYNKGGKVRGCGLARRKRG